MIRLDRTLVGFSMFVASGMVLAQVPTADNSTLSPVSTASPVANTSAARAGKIIMYRGSSVMGAAVGCPLRYKGKELIELGRGKFGEWAVPTGRYILTNKTASVEVSVEAGETRYVRCSIKPGFMSGRADLQVVDEETFAEHRADYEQKTVTDPLAAL